MYINLCVYRARCQVLYIATVGTHLESYHLVEEFGMSCARVIEICYTKPFVLLQ